MTNLIHKTRGSLFLSFALIFLSTLLLSTNPVHGHLVPSLSSNGSLIEFITDERPFLVLRIYFNHENAEFFLGVLNEGRENSMISFNNISANFSWTESGRIELLTKLPAKMVKDLRSSGLILTNPWVIFLGQENGEFRLLDPASSRTLARFFSVSGRNLNLPQVKDLRLRTPELSKRKRKFPAPPQIDPVPFRKKPSSNGLFSRAWINRKHQFILVERIEKKPSSRRNFYVSVNRAMLELIPTIGVNDDGRGWETYTFGIRGGWGIDLVIKFKLIVDHQNNRAWFYRATESEPLVMPDRIDLEPIPSASLSTFAQNTVAELVDNTRSWRALRFFAKEPRTGDIWIGIFSPSSKDIDSYKLYQKKWNEDPVEVSLKHKEILKDGGTSLLVSDNGILVIPPIFCPPSAEALQDRIKKLNEQYFDNLLEIDFEDCDFSQPIFITQEADPVSFQRDDGASFEQYTWLRQPPILAGTSTRIPIFDHCEHLIKTLSPE